MPEMSRERALEMARRVRALIERGAFGEELDRVADILLRVDWEARVEALKFARSTILDYADAAAMFDDIDAELARLASPRWMGPAEYAERHEAGDLPPEETYYTGEKREDDHAD
jgi:hypothetical protein